MINKIATAAEVSFNIAGGIPVVCIASGALRVEAGKMQFVAGLIVVLVGCTGQAFNRAFNNKGSSSDKVWSDLTKLGVEHANHGALNVVRGVSEFAAGVFTFGTFNLIFFFVQMHPDRMFQPIVQYRP